MNSFQTDLTFGKEAEKHVLQLIQKKYPKAHAVEGECKAYDIFVPETLSGIEVKSDRQAHTTGNAFIEVKCNDSPSGICATQAEIANMILMNETRVFHNRPIGESSVVLGHLIPIQTLEQYAMKVTA